MTNADVLKYLLGLDRELILKSNNANSGTVEHTALLEIAIAVQDAIEFMNLKGSK